LTNPPYAFGDSLYPINCHDASVMLALFLMQISRSPDTIENDPLKIDQPAWPNPPWMPRAESVTLDYQSSSDIDPIDLPTKNQFLCLLHLPPSEQSLSRADSHLPTIESLPDHIFAFPQSVTDFDSGVGSIHRISFVLEFSNVIQEVSLLVGLDREGVGPFFEDSRTWVVESCVNGQWLTVDNVGILDGTLGLTQNGILELILPLQFHSNRLRLTVREGFSIPPSFMCLETNAVWVNDESCDASQGLTRPLPPDSIKRSTDPLPAVSVIRQSLPSTFVGSKSILTPDSLRLAERLRHKNQAIQADDYACILLDSFPQLWQVAILSASNSQGKLSPGSVTIVPIPGPDAGVFVDTTVPGFDTSLSDRILARLRTCVSPFVRLEVTKPPYCRIEVHATLVLAEGAPIDTVLQQLNNDLVLFLSPWVPPPEIGRRVANYYERAAIHSFILTRPYVAAIVELKLRRHLHENLHRRAPRGFVYYTSALKHVLRIRSEKTSLGSPALFAHTKS
jgi:hypothetical protein